MYEIYKSCCNNSLQSIQFFITDVDSLIRFSCAIKAWIIWHLHCILAHMVLHWEINKWKIIWPFFISLINLMKARLSYIINLIVLWYISFFEITYIWKIWIICAYLSLHRKMYRKIKILLSIERWIEVINPSFNRKINRSDKILGCTWMLY